MKKLITNINGGFPFVLDDIRWMDEGHIERFKAILDAFGLTGQDFIISGCQVTSTSTDYQISDGYVYINGDIRKVVSHTIQKIPPAGNGHFWTTYENYDPSGNKTFEDGSTHDTYKNLFAKVIIQPNNIGGLDLFDPNLIDRVSNYVKGQLSSTLEAPREVGSPGQPPFIFGWQHQPGFEKVSFYKDFQATVILQGKAFRNFGTNNTIFILPAGYRPANTRLFTTTGETIFGTQVLIRITISSTGSVVVSNLSDNNSLRAVSLDCVRFRV